MRRESDHEAKSLEPGRPVRVLHIDDDPSFTDLMAKRLSTHGIHIEACNDERLAEQMLIDGNYRVVLLDIDMPHCDGLDLLRKIKSYDGTIQVIMLTGIVRMYVILNALRDGAEFCFFKPVEEVEPIVKAIKSTARRLDHWREAVHHARTELEKLQATAG